MNDVAPHSIFVDHHKLSDYEGKPLLSAHQSTLASIVADLPKADWNEFVRLRELLIGNFDESAYKQAAKDMMIGTSKYNRFFEILQHVHFSSNWHTIDKDIYLDILSRLAQYSASFEMRQHVFVSAMRILDEISKKPCTNRFGRMNNQRMSYLKKLDFIYELAKPDSMSRQLVMDELLECAENGPGHLSKTQAIVGLRKIAYKQSRLLIETELSDKDPIVRQRTINLLGWLNGKYPIVLLLKSYLNCDSRERTLITKTLRNHHYPRYQIELARLLARNPVKYAALQELAI